MAIGTLGTTAQTSFTAIEFTGNMAPADLATINNAIFKDNNPAYNTVPEVAPHALATDGTLEFPGGRGQILLKPGDIVAVDPTTGWPIVISLNCATNGAIVTTVSPL